MSGLTKSLFHAGPQQRRWPFLTYVISVILAWIHKQGRALVRFQLYQIWLGIAQPRWGFQGDLQYHIQTNESAPKYIQLCLQYLWTFGCSHVASIGGFQKVIRSRHSGTPDKSMDGLWHVETCLSTIFPIFASNIGLLRDVQLIPIKEATQAFGPGRLCFFL